MSAKPPIKTVGDVLADQLALRELVENWPLLWRDARDWERFAPV